MSDATGRPLDALRADLRAAAALLRDFVDATLHSSPGFRRELPARLRVMEAATADALRTVLAPLGVTVETATPLRSLSRNPRRRTRRRH